MGSGQLPSGSGGAAQIRSVLLTTQTQVAIGNTETVALAANPNRRNAVFENLGSTDIYLYFTTGAGGSAPIILKGGIGQGISLYEEGVGVYLGVVYAVSPTSGTLGVIEET